LKETIFIAVNMSGLSHFESRTGKLNCTAEEVFRFVTDIRNFERFLPAKTVLNWNSERESCSFSVPVVGTVKVRLISREEFSNVVFRGDALRENDFTLSLDISDRHESVTEVKVSLVADLNPMIKMMASRPVNQFLEMLIQEMEGFSDWNNIIE
jgi:carbon monoxide dehydrogenase subunit G